ncbi:MAG: hypothetical protein P1V97_29095 [Planctomycetota bacterium]|nr:hypothetical protein [Planctomycetota bacterium]
MLWDILLSIGYIAILVFCWRLPGRLNRLEEKEEASTKQISELEEQLSHFTKKVWKVDSQSLNVGLLTFTELQILAAQGKVTKQTLLLKMKYKPGTTDYDGEQKLIAGEIEEMNGIFQVLEENGD